MNNKSITRITGMSALLLSLLMPLGCAHRTEYQLNTMHSIDQKTFGQMPDGRNVTLYTLQNKNGMTIKVMDYGAILTEVIVPDRDGNPGNVVAGFDNLAA